VARHNELMFIVAVQEFAGRFHHGGWAHPWLGLVIWLVFVAAIGVAVWAFLRPAHWAHVGPTPAGGPAQDNAMEILRARFAHGEIDADEFAARAAHLAGDVPPVAPPTDEGPTPEEPPAPPTT
jgi:uncharacterized membrane protein